jgi:hypothetical protein
MNSLHQTKSKAPLIAIFILSGLVSISWLIAALFSSQPLPQGLMLVFAQSMLAFFTFTLLVKTLPIHQAVYGPSLNFVIGLHVLIYYGISNVIPALLQELRPQNIIMSVTYRIPSSSVLAYVTATIAAMLMLLGMIVGSHFAFKVWTLRRWHRLRTIDLRYLWLPGYKLAMFTCVILLALVAVGTLMYGMRYDSGLLSANMVRKFSLCQQLFFHGLFHFLPIAPMLAATALVQATMSHQLRLARWLLATACLMTVMALSVWGMRSTAMMALILPLSLLVYVGKVKWRKIALPALGLIMVVYGAVTFIRGSELKSLLSRTLNITKLSMSDVVSAAMTARNEKQTVLKRALGDISYRTAGLEAAASLIQAQTEGHLSLQWGKTIQAGFLQALPVSLRPAFEISERIKTAPAYLGIFQAGDWVTTLLSEFVLDFGPFLLFIPAVIAGMLLGLIDRALLWFGQNPALEGLLIVRFAFLLFIIANGGSLAGMTLMFFKAAFGFIVLFILTGNIARISFRTSAHVTNSN